MYMGGAWQQRGYPRVPTGHASLMAPPWVGKDVTGRTDTTAGSMYDDVTRQLSNLVDVEYAGLKVALDAAGVPWSPGRGIQ